MADAWEQRIRRIMSGEARGPLAGACRLLLRAMEIPYTFVVRQRNLLYNRRLRKTVRLARPVISVGNITTGGTGKTPMVQWLAGKLIEEDQRPAILLRGYRAKDGQSDEQQLLNDAINPKSEARKDRDKGQGGKGQEKIRVTKPEIRNTSTALGTGKSKIQNVPIVADANRLRAAARALVHQPDTSVFVLDDGMQHRRVGRDFDLVLISAAEPFGFGHVLPRGLLREPLAGLARASAFVITHAECVDEQSIKNIRQTLHAHQPAAPIYLAEHAIVGYTDAQQHDLPVDSVQDRRIFLFCGIGQPEAFAAQVRQSRANVVGHFWLADHHGYRVGDLMRIADRARRADAELLLTTEKDWTKLQCMQIPSSPPIWRARLMMKFRGNDEIDLFERIRTATHFSNRDR